MDDVALTYQIYHQTIKSNNGFQKCHDTNRLCHEFFFLAFFWFCFVCHLCHVLKQILSLWTFATTFEHLLLTCALLHYLVMQSCVSPSLLLCLFPSVLFLFLGNKLFCRDLSFFDLCLLHYLQTWFFILLNITPPALTPWSTSGSSTSLFQLYLQNASLFPVCVHSLMCKHNISTTAQKHFMHCRTI